MAAFFILCLGHAVKAEQATLAWNPVQQATGYLLYFGNQSHDYTNSIDVGNVMTYTVVNLDATLTSYFSLKAYDNSGGQSGFSDEVILSPSTQGGGTGTGDGATASSAGADSGGGGGGGGCFIATAIYGPESREVFILRRFRDNHLATNWPGRLFVTLYYRFSPSIARIIDGSPSLRAVGRCLLSPVVFAVGHLFMALSVVCVLGVLVIARQARRRGRKALPHARR